MIDTGFTIDISEWWRNGVGPGWWGICQRAHDQLIAIDPTYNPVQIKEKFGGLRYYFDSLFPWDTPEWEAMSKAVADAESESFTVCEDCGQPGELRSKDRYWLKTLCDQCDNRWLAARSSLE